MIAVSDSFKKAIKSDNREIHGYVDVVYDKQEGDYSVTQIPTISPLSKQDGSDLIDDIKVMKNYATLENNYFLLDGSFILANTNTLESSGGYISEDIFSDISDNTITLVSSETGYVTTKGFTIFFKDNIPFDFDIVITTEYGEEEDETITINVRNNVRHNYQHIFDEEITIKKFVLNILNTEYEDRRIRISNINFSLSDLYEGEELVSFEVNEEIDLLVESIPINTCIINLNNFKDENGNVKFDPINPVGLVSYLTENTTMIPYIGVLTEENGIEYVRMGTFYLKDWSSDNDNNVTLNGENLVGRLQKIDISSNGNFLRTTFTGSSIGPYFTDMTGYTFKFISGTYHNDYLQDYNLLNWITANMPFQIMSYNTTPPAHYNKRKFHITRDNIASEDALNEELVESISRYELINDVKYETKPVINKVEINDITSYSMSSSTRENILVDTYTLKDTEEYVWYKLDKYTGYNESTFSYTSTSGATATLIDKGYYMIYVKFTGNVGDSITITYNGYVLENPPTKTWVWTNDLKSGETMSLDFTKYYNASNNQLKYSAQYYLTMDAKYKVTGTTIGDPSLESGDTISIQTRYTDTDDGYKNIIITKQKFTYDGGLQCELEGRGN